MKKLKRNTQDRVLAGVLSGLADYFEIESWILRVVFFITFFFIPPVNFYLFILYIAFWFFLSEKEIEALNNEQDDE